MTRFELRPGFVALVCLLYYISPAQWFWPFVLLMAVHELGHILVLLCLHIPVEQLQLGALGAQLRTGEMHGVQELWCALAGPAVNLLLFFLLLRPLPRWAMLSALLAAFNLLPVYPLDGGRIVRIVLRRLLPLHRADQAELAIGAALVLLSAALSLRAAILGPHGLWPLLLSAALFVRLALCRNSA